ncbi:PASTA domain-containing protein [Nocardia tenerifensis]|nr:PASTA domain-containing protein [Nocardia tenerifensis]
MTSHQLERSDRIGPQHKRKQTREWHISARIAGICGLIVLAVTGCGVDSSSGKTMTASVTTASTAPTISTVALPPSSTVPKSSASQAAPPPPSPARQVPAASVPMPNVVCMNLQAAQNKIQEAGVWYSRSTDATGKGRRQVLDANWIVVAQTPNPGVLIGEGDAVLSVVKNGEPNSCR